MSDIREALVALLWERFGAEPTAPLAEWLEHQDCVRFADAILAEFDVTERGVHNHDIDPACPEMRLPDGSLRGACTTNVTPPTVKPSVEDVARALAELNEDTDWEGGVESYLPDARAVLALLPGRTEAEVKAEELREVASAAVTEGEGIPWDDDRDRATVSAWLLDRAASFEKGEGRG